MTRERNVFYPTHSTQELQPLVRANQQKRRNAPGSLEVRLVSTDGNALRGQRTLRDEL